MECADPKYEVFRTKSNWREQLTLSPKVCLDFQALVQPTLVPPSTTSQFLDSPALDGGGQRGPRVASSHFVPLPPSPLSSAAVLLPLQPLMFMPGHPDVPPVLRPQRWDLWVFHVTRRRRSRARRTRPPHAFQSWIGHLKSSFADRPLFSTDFEGLTNGAAACMRQQVLDFYLDNTFLLGAKFARFQRFCEDHDLRVFPAHPSSVCPYVRFLLEEGQISVQSLPQYLAAISAVHQSHEYLAFSTFSGFARHLTLAWRWAVPIRPSSASPVVVVVVYRIFNLGLSTSDIPTFRACTSSVLDFVFFNRPVSGPLLLVGDVSVADDVIVFREPRTKGTRGAVPG